MERIVSFEDFKKKATEIAEDHTMEGDHEKQHYMFFQNLASIKHYVDEIMKMNPDDVDNLIKNGHDWAADHISTSKDDVQEVAEWIRNRMEEHREEDEEEEAGEETGMIEPENIKIEIEGDDDNVEIEDGEKEETEEEDEEE
jgi:hypothetical protein